MGTGCAALASRTSGRDRMARAVTAMQLTATGGQPVWPGPHLHMPHTRRSRAADHMWFIDSAYMPLQHPCVPYDDHRP